MGCCAATPIKEKMLLVKEANLQFQKLNAEEIHAAFKLTEDSPIYTDSLVKQVLKNLGLTYNESDENTYLNPFLSIFLKETIKVEGDGELDTQVLSSTMILMCKSRDWLKAKMIYETFDLGNNDSLCSEELNFMLKELLLSVDKFSAVFSGENLDLDMMLKNVRDEIVRC